MASRTTFDDLGINLHQNILARLQSVDFASADCVSRSWNCACRGILSSPKLSSACSFNASLQVAVEDVVNEVLSKPIRPHFALAYVVSRVDLQEAHQLITAKLSSKVPVIVNHCSGVIEKDRVSDEFKERKFTCNAEDGVYLCVPDGTIMLIVGFLPGIKVEAIPLLKQTEDRRKFMIDKFVTDICEFSTSVSGHQSPAAIMIFGKSFRQIVMEAVMENLDFAMSPETVIVAAHCWCSLRSISRDIGAVALVFVADRNKPPGIGETQFHSVLSSGLIPVGPTYEVTYVTERLGFFSLGLLLDEKDRMRILMLKQV